MIITSTKSPHSIVNIYIKSNFFSSDCLPTFVLFPMQALQSRYNDRFSKNNILLFRYWVVFYFVNLRFWPWIYEVLLRFLLLPNFKHLSSFRNSSSPFVHHWFWCFHINHEQNCQHNFYGNFHAIVWHKNSGHECCNSIINNLQKQKRRMCIYNCNLQPNRRKICSLKTIIYTWIMRGFAYVSAFCFVWRRRRRRRHWSHANQNRNTSLEEL